MEKRSVDWMSQESLHRREFSSRIEPHSVLVGFEWAKNQGKNILDQGSGSVGVLK